MGNSKLNKLLTKTLSQWQLQKNKLSKVSSTKFGRPMMSTRVENSTRKRPKSSFKILLETSDPVTNSLMRLSMRSSLPSIRTTPVPSRKVRWLFSSNNSSVDNEHLHLHNYYDEDQRNEDIDDSRI